MIKLNNFDLAGVKEFAEANLSPSFLKLGFTLISVEHYGRLKDIVVVYLSVNDNKIKVHFDQKENGFYHVHFDNFVPKDKELLNSIFSFIPIDASLAIDLFDSYLKIGRKTHLLSNFECRQDNFPACLLNRQYSQYGFSRKHTSRTPVNFTESIITRVVYSSFGQVLLSAGKHSTQTSIINSKIDFHIIDGELIPFLRLKIAFSPDLKVKMLVSLNPSLTKKYYVYGKKVNDVESINDYNEVSNINEYMEKTFNKVVFKRLKELFSITEDYYLKMTNKDFEYFKSTLEMIRI